MTVIKIIAFVIFIIACVTIYHNTNSFEPKKRILYIIIGMIVMYGITSIICAIDINDIQVDNEQAINDTLNVIKMIFTPINSMIILSSLGNTFGKAKDQEITTEKAGRRTILILIAFIIILIFETNYIGDFITRVLGQQFYKYRKRINMNKPKVIVICGPTASRKNWNFNGTCEDNKW